MSYAILLAAVISWGISNPLADLAITKLSPLFLSLLECSVGFLFLLAVTIVKRIKPVIPWRLIIPIGILQPGLAWLLGNIGYTHETASTGVLILTGETLFTVLLGILWLGDRLSFKKWIFFIAGFAGVFIAGNTGIHEHSTSTAVFFLMSAMTFGVYANVVRRYLDHYTATDLALGQTFISTIFLGLFFILSEQSIPTVSTSIWSSAILSGLFGVGLPFVAFNYAIKMLPGSTPGIYLNIVPIAGIAASIALGRGAPTWMQLIGGLIVIISTYVVSREDEVTLMTQRELDAIAREDAEAGRLTRDKLEPGVDESLYYRRNPNTLKPYVYGGDLDDPDPNR
jgi:drug/metabolite transporter (DMT)-like permease